MSKGLISKSILSAIADAIRGKTGSSDQIKPVDMAGLISAITTGGGSGGVSTPFSKFEIVSFAGSGNNGASTEIKHNLGVVPDVVFIFTSATTYPEETFLQYLKAFVYTPDGGTMTHYNDSYGNTHMIDFTETTIIQKAPLLYQAGKNYYCILIKF